MKIFELKKQQAEALEALQWIADEPDSEDQDLIDIKKILDSVQGAVENKLDYWMPLLKQAQFDAEQAKEAKRRYVAAHDANIIRKEKVSKWINEHILSLMVDFGIDKHKGELFKCSHYKSVGSLQFGDTFNVETLYKRYTKTIVEPNKEEITKALKAIDNGEDVVKCDDIPGCYLVKKEILRVS